MSHWSDCRATKKSQNGSLFNRRHLLTEYSHRIQNWATHAYSLALMNGSLFLRDAFAFAATKELCDSRELLGRILQKETRNIDFRYEWLFRLGRLVALQNMDESDANLALFCLRESTYNLRLRSHRIENLRLQVELLAETNQYKRAQEVLLEAHALYGEEHEYLSVDLNNPFVNPEGASVEEWLQGLNRPFRASNLTGIRLSDDREGSPFDRLVAEPSPGPTPTSPLISVIMTSYAPDEQAFELAARSILGQSWGNLELVVVDDATPGGPPRVIEELARDDPRVKLVQLSKNRGTYHARNAGLRAAIGEYVTGQDSDDWSHPDRLLRQIRALERNPNAVGTVTKAMRTDDNLFRILRGIQPERLCEVSLMFSARVGREVGGYLESRKGADSEFRLRLELVSGKSVKMVDEPLYMTRLSTGSLSRSDFKRGWAHQNRRAFSNLIKHWHKTAAPKELLLGDVQVGGRAIPPKFRSLGSITRTFDYVVLLDWRYDDAATRNALSEILLLQQAGKRVGIMQSSGLFAGMGHAARLSPEIQDLINREALTLVIPDENAEIGALIIRSAELLQFAPKHSFQGTVDQLFIVADQPPSAWDGTSPIYHPEACSEFASNEFGRQPVWLAQDPAIHRYLTRYAGDIDVWPNLLPHVLPDANLRTRMRAHRATPTRVVIGRHARNIEALWPRETYTTDTLWPTENEDHIEVRTFGEAQCYLQKLNRHFFPNNWVSFRTGDISQDAFYSHVDYFVYYPDENWPQEFCLEALMAHASGCAVILPERFRNMHKSRAVYSDAAVVPLLMREHQRQEQTTRDVKKQLNDEQAATSMSRYSFLEAVNMLTHSARRKETKVG